MDKDEEGSQAICAHHDFGRRRPPLPTGPERTCHGRAWGGVSADGMVEWCSGDPLGPAMRRPCEPIFCECVCDACGLVHAALRRTLAYLSGGDVMMHMAAWRACCRLCAVLMFSTCGASSGTSVCVEHIYLSIYVRCARHIRYHPLRMMRTARSRMALMLCQRKTILGCFHDQLPSAPS